MPDEQSGNINLLSGHHERKHAKADDMGGKIEYIEPGASGNNAEPAAPSQGAAVDFLTRRRLPPLSSDAIKSAALQESGGEKAESREASPEENSAQPAGETMASGGSWWSNLTAKFKRSKEPATTVEQPEPAVLAAEQALSEAQEKSVAEPSLAPITAEPLPAAKPESLPPSSPPPPPEPESKISPKETPSLPQEAEQKPAEPGLEVNLLSAEYAQTFAVARQKEVLLWSLAVTLLFLAVLYLSAHWLEKSALGEVRRVEAAAAELETVIATYKDVAKEDAALRRRLTAVKALLKRHVSLKMFLEKLESVTIPEVTYGNIAVSGAGGLNMAARATSYTTLARQLVVFSQKALWIKEVNLTSARLAGDPGAKSSAVAFDLSFKIDENAFLINPPEEVKGAEEEQGAPAQ